MNTLLINPPYQTITSNFGVGHQVPLGLLAVGGPLIDAGHRVSLLDAERRHMTPRAVALAVQQSAADVVMTGHAGSTPAHPVCLEMLRHIKQRCPEVRTVYGGVYPTYHARQIIDQEPAVDFVIRGEGEAAAADLLAAVQCGATDSDLAAVPGIVFRSGDRVVVTGPRSPIEDLDACRVGWELIEDWDDYECFGLGRAAIIQFSRGCPHRCTYCGQHGFWNRWRHRNPVRLADELEWLWRRHSVRFITLADENPTTDPALWRRLLQELAHRRLPIHFFATIRATDIVRDAELGTLPLYRQAGILYVLMGVESTDASVLRDVRKRSTPRHDILACRLLRQHGVFSVLGHISGLGDETWASLRATRRRLRRYEADYLNAMYVTPHDWTPFGRQALNQRALVEPDQRRWDYRHPVLAQERLRPWQLFAAVKWMELRFHLRPARLVRMLKVRDPFMRRQLWWCAWHTGMVYVAEIVEFAGRTAARAASGIWRVVKTALRGGSAAHPVAARRQTPLPVLGVSRV